MLYKLIRWTRQIRAWFFGNKNEEGRFVIIRLKEPMAPLEFRKRLIPLCYEYNMFSTTYRGQIFTVRKVDPDVIHQYHLRLYPDRVTGHYEIDWFHDEKAHNKGVDLRALTKGEIAEIRRRLYE